LKAIDLLVREGATVVGSKPTRLTGLPTARATDAQIVVLADRLWAGCGTKGQTASKAGAGKIVCGESAREALKNDGVAPDLISAGPASDADFDFVHRRVGGTEIYFIRNIRPAAVATVMSFRIHGLAPEMWTPESGAIAPLGLYASTADGRTNLPLWFPPYGSTVIVFRRAAGAHLVRLERDGQEVFPRLTPGTAPFTANVQNGRILLQAEQGGRYAATDAAGRRYTATVTEPLVTPLGSPWTLKFPPNWGAPAVVHLDKLASWSEAKEEGVRHFSGTVAYTADFQVPAQLPEHARVELDLGDVRETARVAVNGKEVGVLWKKPFIIDLTSVVHGGTNALRVEVTNLWPNRIIGDQSLPADKRFTHTNITKFKADTPLMPSGLLGPVNLRITHAVAMHPDQTSTR